MPFGDVTKFRAKSCEREENAWVLGCSQTKKAFSAWLTRVVPHFLSMCSLLFQLLIRGAIQLSCCYFQLDDQKVTEFVVVLLSFFLIQSLHQKPIGKTDAID